MNCRRSAVFKLARSWPSQIVGGITVLSHRRVTSLSTLNSLPIVYHPAYSAPVLRQGHRFPMQVFRRIYDRLIQSNLIELEQVYQPARLPSREVISLVHSPQFLSDFEQGTLSEEKERRIGFGDAVRTPILVERTKAEVAGTILTAELALKYGLACNTAGGTHHAYPDFGSGFCILNDLAITAEELLKRGSVQRVLILDLDVHQGDGTAYIFNGRRDVFTLSVHCESNFPVRKQQSTLDVGLRDGTGDTEYLCAVSDVLQDTLQAFRPDIVLYDAGVDVHKDDSLGRLNVTDDGLARRELLVLDTCLAFGVPVAGYVGGGYADNLDVLADRHIQLHRAALTMWKEYC